MRVYRKLLRYMLAILSMYRALLNTERRLLKVSYYNERNMERDYKVQINRVERNKLFHLELFKCEVS